MSVKKNVVNETVEIGTGVVVLNVRGGIHFYVCKVLKSMWSCHENNLI